MKTSSVELSEIWGELIDIFVPSGRLNKKSITRLMRLGFDVDIKGKHPKLRFMYKGKSRLVVLSSSPSDYNSGRQTLREIRRIYGNE